MTNHSDKPGSVQLNELLAKLNREGGFPISILTDSQGFAIAAAAEDGMNPDRQSAVVAFIQKTASQVTRQLGFSGSEEISLMDNEGKHLVCRSFKVKNMDLILSIMINGRSSSYRRLTTGAIKQIIEIWADYWE
jgi:predicted regulator of Ras-like GTPase activity (Roadblock/LC7/MglB family)